MLSYSTDLNPAPAEPPPTLVEQLGPVLDPLKPMLFQVASVGLAIACVLIALRQGWLLLRQMATAYVNSDRFADPDDKVRD